MKKNRNKKKSIIIGIVLLIAALTAGSIYMYQKAEKVKRKAANEKAYQKIQEQVVTEPEETRDDATGATGTTNDISVDFAALQAMNPDIYAWIYIPDTNVSYPVVQSGGEDQSYYLNYTVERTYGLPGSIYTEKVNSKDFTDFNTLVYGHEMMDGSMFGSLKNYRDTTFWESHPEIYIYTPEKKLTFRIFAAVVFPDTYIPEGYDFSTVEGKGQYLTDIQSLTDINSHIFEDARLDEQSRLLTLSTCISDQPNNRYLVEAYLTNEE